MKTKQPMKMIVSCCTVAILLLFSFNSGYTKELKIKNVSASDFNVVRECSFFDTTISVSGPVLTIHGLLSVKKGETPNSLVVSVMTGPTMLRNHYIKMDSVMSYKVIQSPDDNPFYALIFSYPFGYEPGMGVSIKDVKL